MADEFQSNICSGNWWDTTARNNKFNNSGSSSTTSTELNNSIGISYGWASTDMASRSTNSVDSVSVSGGGGGGCSMVFGDTQKLQGHDSAGGGGESSGVLSDHSLQMMGLGLPSQGMEWNQALIRSGKAEGGFRSMLQEDHHLNPNTNYQQETGMATSPQQLQWRQQKVFSGGVGEESSSSVHRGFSLDQPQFASHTNSGDSVVTCQGLSIGSSNFQMDNSALYGSPSPSTILQGFQSPFDQNRSLEYPNYAANYGMNSNDQLFPSLSKFPHFMRTNSPPKQPPHNQLHFSNNATFWNASATAMTDVRSSFLPSLQTQFSAPTFDEKPKPNKSEARDSSSSVVKKSGGEVSMKRPRNETSSPLPPFKVRKEKMGDRITALQQLVSPFGKTDTASVLSEAIEYIKFLHEQVTVLSTPYMKSGASIQHHHQSSEKSKDPEGPKQDLRSRGLCLVPVSSTFPVTHETTVDFWTPTFGGTFR